MIRSEWLRPDGSIDYEKYMDSPQWRRFREGYWYRNPNAVCVRCGMDNSRHKQTFGTRLHLQHVHYSTIGHELDEDMEPICKPCHVSEHSGIQISYRPLTIQDMERLEAERMASPDYWDNALERIAAKRQQLARQYDHDDPKLWSELERLVKLQRYAEQCRISHAIEESLA